jgi:hypothetical protein
VPFRRHFPELLQADSVDLRRHAVAQLEARLEAFPEMAARAFREDRVLRLEVDARLVARRLLAAAPDAHVARRDAAHAPVVREEHVRGGEAGIDLDAQRFGLASHPAADVPEARDVVAVVPEAFREHPSGNAACGRSGEEEEPVLGDGLVQRGAARLPVREELRERHRIDHRAGEDVRADLRSLLDHAHGELAARGRRQLLQPDRRGEARGAGAHDHDVVLHRFAIGHGEPSKCGCGASASPRLRRTPRARGRRARGCRRRARRRGASRPPRPSP